VVVEEDDEVGALGVAAPFPESAFAFRPGDEDRARVGEDVWLPTLLREGDALTEIGVFEPMERLGRSGRVAAEELCERR